VTVRQRYQPLTFVIPPGTLITAPHRATVTLGDAWLTSVTWRIPPGPAGTCGFLVTFNGQAIVPWSKTHTYVIGTDEKTTVPVNAEITKHVSVVGYNNDIRLHTIYFRFLYTPMTLKNATTVASSSALVIG
jgi:hypothetical protein